MNTIALIDNHPIIRTGLGLFLKKSFDEVTVMESDSILSLYTLDPNQVPDLVILGISQSSFNENLGLINATKKYFSSSHIIIYDETPRSSLVLHYLRAGAKGYLTKLNSANELVDCIGEVLKGKRYICNEVFDVILDRYPFEKMKSSKVNELLTSREFEIAKYLSEGMKTSSIAQKLGRKASTISTTKNNIYKKLHVDNILKLREAILPEPVASHK